MKKLALKARAHRTVLLAALMLVALAPWTASAQAPTQGMASPAEGDGLIIRIQSADLVFIDRGAEHNINRGDLFDIISSEMLIHPLSDSILAVTPKSVGSLQVLQVYPRTSLAKLIQLDRDEDPMLKPIARVRDAERRATIEKQMLHGMRVASGMDVSRRLAIIPGLYQTRIGETRKGWALMAATGLSLVGGFAYRSNSSDWYDQYQSLQAGLPESKYTQYFTKAQDLRSRSNRLFWLAGALYVYNWADIMWLGSGSGMAAQTPPPGSRLHVALGMGSAGEGPLLRLTHRF